MGKRGGEEGEGNTEGFGFVWRNREPLNKICSGLEKWTLDNERFISACEIWNPLSDGETAVPPCHGCYINTWLEKREEVEGRRVR